LAVLGWLFLRMLTNKNDC